MKSVSRRDFLKLSGITLGGLVLNPFIPENNHLEDVDLVRVTTTSVSVHTRPSDEYRITGTWYRDDILHVYEVVRAETPEWNPYWYRVWGGYIHREYLQKVRIDYNQPLTSVPETKLLAEVTVPYTQPYLHNRWEGWKGLDWRLYYSSVHWIVSVETGPNNQPWYRILDEADESNYFVPAIHMRPILPEELAPIKPEAPFESKRIEVSLDKQTMICYENGQGIREMAISTGRAYLSLTGESTTTPVGRFRIISKYPSKHMGDADLASDIDDYNLPGVPWVCFFTEKGHAFHGTYWHDNFGVPMSHGCVNMRPAEALWLFRWAHPASAFEDIDKQRLYRTGFGTQVDIL